MQLKHTQKYIDEYFSFQVLVPITLLLNVLWLSPRFISIGQLNVLLHLHLQPITTQSIWNLTTLWYGISYLRVGFTLRCFQRLSLPNLATQLCHWYDNWCTSGLFSLVLSYQGQLPSNILRLRQIRTELSHDVLNPARVPL